MSSNEVKNQRKQTYVVVSGTSSTTELITQCPQLASATPPTWLFNNIKRPDPKRGNTTHEFGTETESRSHNAGVHRRAYVRFPITRSNKAGRTQVDHQPNKMDSKIRRTPRKQGGRSLMRCTV